MANEKNVAVEAKKDLVKSVKFRRRRYEIEDEQTGEKSVGEYIECTADFKGETVRFKVDERSSKMVKVLMKIYGYPLYDTDGVSIVKEEDMPDEL